MNLSKIKNIEVLNLEWTSEASRDRTVATLVCNYLREMGLRVLEGNIFLGYILLVLYRPKILFITNIFGCRCSSKYVAVM